MHIEYDPTSGDFRNAIFVPILFQDVYEVTNLLEFFAYHWLCKNLKVLPEEMLSDQYEYWTNLHDPKDVPQSSMEDDFYNLTALKAMTILNKTQTIRKDVNYRTATPQKRTYLYVCIDNNTELITKVTIENCGWYDVNKEVINILDRCVKDIGLDLGITPKAFLKLCNGDISHQKAVVKELGLGNAYFVAQEMTWGSHMSPDDYESPQGIDQSEWWEYLRYGLNLCVHTSATITSEEIVQNNLRAVLSYPEEFIKYHTGGMPNLITHICNQYTGMVRSNKSSSDNTDDVFLCVVRKYEKYLNDEAKCVLIMYCKSKLLRKDRELFYPMYITALEHRDQFKWFQAKSKFHIFEPTLNNHPEDFDRMFKAMSRSEVTQFCGGSSNTKFARYVKLKG